MKLQTVDEHSLQLSDVVTGLYRNAESAWGAWQPTSWVVCRLIVAPTEIFIEGASYCTRKILADIQVVMLRGQTAVVLRIMWPTV